MHIIHRDKKALYYFSAHYVADWWLHQPLRLILNSAKKGTGKCFHDKEVNKCLQAVFPPLSWLRSIAHVASGLLQVVTCKGSNVSGAISAVTENYEHKRTAVHFQAFTRLSRFLKNVFFSFQPDQNCQLSPSELHHADVPSLLHFAAQYGFTSVSSLLLQCPGAERALRTANLHGQTPTEIAKSHGHAELHVLLRETLVTTSYSLPPSTPSFHLAAAGTHLCFRILLWLYWPLVHWRPFSKCQSLMTASSCPVICELIKTTQWHYSSVWWWLGVMSAEWISPAVKPNANTQERSYLHQDGVRTVSERRVINNEPSGEDGKVESREDDLCVLLTSVSSPSSS